MKISNFPKWCGRVYDAISLVEVLIVIAIIGLLAAIAVPNYIKAKEQSEKRKVAEQNVLHVGDVVNIQGIDQKGTVNYLPENGYADILIIGKNGEPTILKGVNIQLISR